MYNCPIHGDTVHPYCPECKTSYTATGGGGKKDAEKVRFDLLPGEALFAIAKVLTTGTKKYEDRNWENGMKWSRVFSATLRHLWAWWAAPGSKTNVNFIFDELDDEWQYSHLWHAGCCILFLITYEERNLGEDDRWTRPL